MELTENNQSNDKKQAKRYVQLLAGHNCTTGTADLA
jgi:hypothetical protein